MAANEEVRRLLVDNAALSTELRMAKEQLSQANNANLYLLGRLAASSSAVLGNHALAVDVSNFPEHSKDPKLADASSASEKARDEDLLSFDDCQTNGDINPVLVRNHKSFSKPVPSIGLGVANELPSGWGTDRNIQGWHQRKGRDSKVTRSGGTTIVVPTSLSNTVHFPHPPYNFLDSEHNRLLGAACFVEAQSAEEQASHWILYAQSFPRHTAQAYKAYYETFIRPEYLNKLSRNTGAPEREVRGTDSGYVESAGCSNPPDESLDAAFAEKKLPVISLKVAETEDLTPPTGCFSSDAKTMCKPLTFSSSVNESLATNDPIHGNISTGSRLSDVSTVATRCDTPIQSPNRAPPRISPCQVDELWAHRGDDRSYAVAISNIPPEVNIPTVLAKSVQGPIVSATHLKTAGMKTVPPLDSNGAIIVLPTSIEARGFIEHRRQNPVYFWSDKRQANMKAGFQLIQTPSWLLSARLGAASVEMSASQSPPRPNQNSYGCVGFVEHTEVTYRPLQRLETVRRSQYRADAV